MDVITSHLDTLIASKREKHPNFREQLIPVYFHDLHQPSVWTAPLDHDGMVSEHDRNVLQRPDASEMLIATSGVIREEALADVIDRLCKGIRDRLYRKAVRVEDIVSITFPVVEDATNGMARITIKCKLVYL